MRANDFRLTLNSRHRQAPPTIVRDQFVLLSVTISLPEHLTERRFHDVVVAVLCAGPEPIPSPPDLGPDKLPQWHARLR